MQFYVRKVSKILPSAVKIFIEFDDSHLSSDRGCLSMFVRHYETRKTKMRQSEVSIICCNLSLTSCDPLPNCKQRTPFLEISNFVLCVGEWSLIRAKWGSYVTIVSLKILWSNIVSGYQTDALPLNFHMPRFRKEKKTLLLFVYFRS